MRKVYLLRRDLGGAGGAERVFEKYRQAFSGECEILPITEKKRAWGPSWWRAMLFAWVADGILQADKTALSVSMERGPRADIYRAGDGVHKRWRALLGGVSLNPLHWVNPMLEERTLRAAKIVIANSKMVAGELRCYYHPWIGPKVRVVYNGYDPKKFCVAKADKMALRRELGLPEDDVLLLFAGSGWKRKGVKQAEAITKLCKNVKARLVVVGKGDPRELDKETIYKGRVDNIEKYYQAADALVLPTLYDPFANAVLEALACGCVVVTTAQNGAAEVIKEGVTGFVMEHPDKNHKEAAYWLETHLGANPEDVADTVQAWTLAHEVAAIKHIFAEVEGAKKND